MTTILNLDPDFKPFGEGIDFKSFLFPSKCEVHIKILALVSSVAIITTRIKSSDDTMLLLMATDALRRSGVEGVYLVVPYLPYARQDRPMVKGEPLSLKVFADLINSQNYKQVAIYDPHSDVAPALINNCHILTNHAFVSEILKDRTNYYIVSPDAGAYKKIFKLAQHIKYEGEIIMCNKIRDVSNGVIRSMTISHDNLKGKECFIIDDICDGGGTFTTLANELKMRGAGDINLIVSHGIFSKGFDVFENINHIYCTNSFNDQENKKLTQIKLNRTHL